MIWLYIAANLVLLALMVKFVSDIMLAVWCNAVYGVPYVPTDMKLVRQAVKMVGCKRGDVVLELGSGDGRALCEFGHRYPIRGVGYEQNGLLLFLSRLRWRLTWPKYGRVSFLRGDLFTVSFKRVDVVYMYLLPWMIDKLRPRLEKELGKGARVISFDYPLKSEKFEVERLIGKGRQKMAIYKKNY